MLGKLPESFERRTAHFKPLKTRVSAAHVVNVFADLLRDLKCRMDERKKVRLRLARHDSGELCEMTLADWALENPTFECSKFDCSGRIWVPTLQTVSYRPPHDLEIDIRSTATHVVATFGMNARITVAYLEDHLAFIKQAFSLETKSNFVLCLSGGGLRALYYHLGVVSCLNRTGMLGDVTKVYSVSGGSILAGHMLQHWPRYVGPKEIFEEIANDLVNRTARLDIRGTIFRHDFSVLSVGVAAAFVLPAVWLYFGLPGALWTAFFLFAFIGAILALWIAKRLRNSRVNRLKSIYNRIFDHCTLRQAAMPEGRDGDRPEVHFLTTGMETGNMASICKDQVTVTRLASSYRTKAESEDFDLSAGFQIAEAVAASSAYPPLFPPVDLNKNCGQALKPRDNTDKKLLDTCLSDGGVFDNLGLRRFTIQQEASPEAITSILACDAGNPLSFSNGPGNIFSLAMRTIEILMSRISHLEELEARKQGNLIAFEIERETPRMFPVSTALQHQIATIRTDLDGFSPEEVLALVHHGFVVALETLRSAGHLPASMPDESPWTPIYCDSILKLEQDVARKRVEKMVKLGASTKLGVFSLRTPIAAVFIALACLAPILSCWLIYSSGFRQLALIEEKHAGEVASKVDELVRVEGKFSDERKKVQEADGALEKQKREAETAKEALAKKEGEMNVSRAAQEAVLARLNSQLKEKETSIAELNQQIVSYKRNEKTMNPGVIALLGELGRTKSAGQGWRTIALGAEATSLEHRFYELTMHSNSKNAEASLLVGFYVPSSSKDAASVLFVAKRNVLTNSREGFLNLDMLAAMFSGSKGIHEGLGWISIKMTPADSNQNVELNPPLTLALEGRATEIHVLRLFGNPSHER